MVVFAIFGEGLYWRLLHVVAPTIAFTLKDLLRKFHRQYCENFIDTSINHYCVQAVVVSMSRYIPVRTTMDSEDHYHAPYDTHDARGDSDAHYEAPSCLKRNPSGSLFIPSGEQKH